MTIDFLNGCIDAEQYKIPEIYQDNKIKFLKDGQLSYGFAMSLWADKEHLLWIDENSLIITSEEKKYLVDSQRDYDDSDFILIFKLPEGFVVDVANNGELINWNNQPDFAVQSTAYYESEGLIVQKAPVIGLITNDFERSQFRDILKSQYPEYEYPEIKSKK